MRRFVFFLCFAIPLFVIAVTVNSFYGLESKPNTIIVPIRPNQIVLPKYPPLLEKVNTKNALIHNFACQDFDLKVWQKGIRLKLSASLYYEKDKNFRMIVRSFLGKECDIGSNKDIFWFWSKRINPPTLHYALHKDYTKTRLKTPFNPRYMMDSLGLGKINLEGKINELEDKFVVVENTINTIGQPIAKFTFVSKKEEKVTGFMISDSTGAPITSGEVLEWDGDKPKQILYVWFEEDISMLLEFRNSFTNVLIDPKYWELPPIEPRIDMGKELAVGMLVE